MKKLKIIFTFLLIVFLQGCGFPDMSGKYYYGEVNDKSRTQLEVRELQTKEFEIADVNLVLKAIIDVLQDDGYIIKNSNAETGVITASKQSQEKLKWFANYDKKVYDTGIMPITTEASISISKFGEKTRVRSNFQVVNFCTIEYDKFYQEFFAKIDKGLFIQKEKL